MVNYSNHWKQQGTQISPECTSWVLDKMKKEAENPVRWGSAFLLCQSPYTSDSVLKTPLQGSTRTSVDLKVFSFLMGHN